jgi:FAD/FMN-containing dehydrogenase
MFKIHTKMSASEAREALIRLAADSSLATGTIASDTFRLYPKPMRRGTPVTFYGRILADRDGTLIRVWSVPHWAIVIFFPIWVWFGRQEVHAPWWFVIVGLVGCIISFLYETHRGYDLLRQTYAA